MEGQEEPASGALDTHSVNSALGQALEWGLLPLLSLGREEVVCFQIIPRVQKKGRRKRQTAIQKTDRSSWLRIKCWGRVRAGTVPRVGKVLAPWQASHPACRQR